MVGGPLHAVSQEPMGWWVISYTNSDAETGKVDFARKCAIQAPRQTVSACMIIGGKQEGLLHKCLDSIEDHVIEILVTDCGMSEESRRILGLYDKVRVLDEKGPNPLEAGFDEARNFGLGEAKGDWILWLDSDETLDDTGRNMYKYLKSNIFKGYAIKQHHFSIQPMDAFKPDMPVRLFRNNIGIKFYGVVHEHPEIKLNDSVGTTTILGDVDIAHNGYLTETGRRRRFLRNIDLMRKDREKYPDRKLGKFLWNRDLMHLCKYELEHNGNRITPNIVAWCEECVKSFQDNFLGEELMFSQEGLSAYSEALLFLNRGIEYTFNIGVGQNMETITSRFADKKDAIKFVNKRVESVSEPFEGKYV
jgi:glycosyltransferase involved in cell wall biosynthesis